MIETRDAPVGGGLQLVDASVAAFIFYEARLADESDYEGWEGLWDDDAVYWVPTHPGSDPEHEVSYIYDNRQRIASRIAQLKTGKRHAQSPPSTMRRLITNMELLGRDDTTVTVGSNFCLYEYHLTLTTWVGRYLHRIRVKDDQLRLVEKTVHLVNAADAMPTLAFLI